MSSFDNEKTITVLNDILEYELAGVVKYTHFALMVTGPNRLTLDKFLNLKQPNRFNTLNRQESC